MKILVLNGSPKREKSDTMHITRAFLDGMKEAAPQDVHIVDIIDKHIEYCTGCFTCKCNGGECIHNDDMKELLGEGNLLQVPLASMGGEDFAYYLEKIPGAFIRLGTADERPESRGALHNGRTVFDEKAILAGAAAFTGAVFRLTGSDMQALK